MFLFTFWYVGTPTELLPMTLIHIYFYGCRWYCVLRDWKRMLDAFCAHWEGKNYRQHLQILLIYFNCHSIRDYSSSRFCFSICADVVWLIYHPLYIYMPQILPPRRIDFICWRTSNQLLAEHTHKKKKRNKQPAIPLFCVITQSQSHQVPPV